MSWFNKANSIDRTKLTADERLPIGTILTTAIPTAPTGYLICDGAAISRTTYAALFAAIGTAYGPGNGTTTFNIPDLRGAFMRVWNQGSVSSIKDPDASARGAYNGGNTGDNLGSKQDSDFLNHSHNYTQKSNNATAGGPDTGLTGASSNAFGNFTQATAAVTGGGPGNETRPVNIYVQAIIKF